MIIKNTFHNTVVSVRPRRDGDWMVLSASTWRRVKRALCGVTDCYCGMRHWEIDGLSPAHYDIFKQRSDGAMYIRLA